MGKNNDIVDVLVIGAGPSGAAFTWSLSEAGIDVLCLEQGDWPDKTAYPQLFDDHEVRRQSEWHPDPNVRGLPQDYPINVDDSDIYPLMHNAVGGSSIHWGAHFPRFHPSDFRMKTLDGVGVDWPVSYGEIEPYFDLNDRMLGIAGLAGDTAYPPKSPRQMPPLPLGVLGETMVKGFDRLGWHWWPSDSAINTAEYDGRDACNFAGPCELGCTRGAKATADVTYWPKALANGARLMTGARVREITLDRDGLASGVVYHDAEGAVREQRARNVVMACNAVGTARLLLNSRSARFPDGLANGSGLLGKNLMMHPVAMVTGVFDHEVDGYKGPLACALFSHEFYETDTSRGFVRGYGFQVVRTFGPVSAALGGVAGHERVPWGKSHREAFSELFNHCITVAIVGDDLPEPSNRVELDPELTDDDGIPAPRIVYKTRDNSRKMLDHGIARAEELMEAAGARRTMTNPQIRAGGWHLLGTARMGDDPEQLGRELPRALPRRPEPVRRGRQRLRDGRRGEPDVYDPGAGAPRGRRLQAECGEVNTRRRAAMTAAKRVLTDAQRELLTRVLDRIVPAGGGLPGAGELGVGEFVESSRPLPDKTVLAGNRRDCSSTA